MTTIINKYLIKCFAKNFSIILAGFSLLFFLINLIDIFNRINDNKISSIILVLLAILKTPQSLTSIILSIVLISAIYTFYQLSNRSEIVIIRNCGYSLLSISKSIIIFSFFLAILWITLFNAFEVWALEKYNYIENNNIKTELRTNIVPQEGFWFKELNYENEGDIIIKINKIFKNSQNLYDTTLWFYNKNYYFYKRIDAKKMTLENKFWVLEDIVLNDNNNINLSIDKLKIPTEIEMNFLHKKILNLENSVYYYNLIDLMTVIKDLEKSGLNARKFKVYFHSRINLLLLFVIMIMFAMYFGENLARNRKSGIKLFCGVVVGLVVFLVSSIFTELGSSGLVSIFEATWLISLIYLAIAILLIYNKENSG